MAILFRQREGVAVTAPSKEVLVYISFKFSRIQAV
jgi:hypothetical protein